MFKQILLPIIAILSVILSCSKPDDNRPVILPPDNPSGTISQSLTPGHSGFYPDGSLHRVSFNQNGQLEGTNFRFATTGFITNLSQTTSIPSFGWTTQSDTLQQGLSLIIASINNTGATFTRLFVQKKDTISGRVDIKYQTPFCGNADKFSFNLASVELNAPQGEKALILSKPTCYQAILTSGLWASFKPSVSYITIKYNENLSGKARFDTVVFKNEHLPEHRIPIVQLSTDY